MMDVDDHDQLLNLVGVILVLFLIISIAGLVLTTMSAPQRSADPPDADWKLQRINESYVRITHAGGEPVQSKNLSVTVDGSPRHPQWTATTLTDGKSGVVRVGNGEMLALLWQPSGPGRDVLQRWQLSRATTR